MTRDHLWQLAPLQRPGLVRRSCAACHAIAETTVAKRRSQTTYAAPHGTPLVVHSMDALPPCTGLAEGSSAPVEEAS